MKGASLGTLPRFLPRPTTTGTSAYKDALTQRFVTSADAVVAHYKELLRKARTAHEVAAQAALAAKSDDHITKQSETDAKKHLAETQAALDQATCALHSNRGLEDACEYAQRALDLQVGKASGLLTFNGLVIAVGTILWINRRAPTWRWLSWSTDTLFFWVMVISSVLTLGLVFVAWGSDKLYKTADADLQRVLRLAALRAWALNVAVLCSLGGVALAADWIANGSENPATTAVTATTPLPVLVQGSVAVTLDGKSFGRPPLTCDMVEAPKNTSGLKWTIRCQTRP